MLGLRLLNRSVAASTSTSVGCTINTARLTSQRHFSLSRALKEEKSNDTPDSTQPSTEADSTLRWRGVAKLAESTATAELPERLSSLRLDEQNARLWTVALRSVSPNSDIPKSAYELSVATRKRTELEEMEHTWSSRKIYGPDHNAVPSAGRSVPVAKGDLARAMANLNSIFRINNVRTELRLGERYEKPNQKRRRLASERHRRRFAHMVREKVQLVSSMRIHALF